MPRMLFVAAVAAFLIPANPLPVYAQEDVQDSYAADAYARELATQKVSREEVDKLNELRDKIARLVFRCKVDGDGELSCPVRTGVHCLDGDIYPRDGIPRLYHVPYTCYQQDEAMMPAVLEMESSLLYTDKYHAYFDCLEETWWGDGLSLNGFGGVCTVGSFTYKVKIEFSALGEET